MTTEAATERRDGSKLIVVDRFRPNPKQRAFFVAAAKPYSEVEEILFHGAIRGGKTQAGVKLLVAWALKYGGTYVISRFSYRELEDSTKKVCLYGDGALPPAIPSQVLRGGSLHLAKNETHNKVTLANGAEILFRALEPRERGKVRNITASGWLIDQAEELEGDDIADFYQEIKGRCSDPRGPRKLLLIANPGPTDHLLYSRFLDPITKYEKSANVHVTIHDNKSNIPYDYYLMLLATEHTNENYFRRMVMGEWGVMGGKRFKTWDPRLHVVEPSVALGDRLVIPSSWTVLEAGDYGFSHYTVWEWLAIAPNGRHYFVAEHAAKETEVADHAKRIKLIRDGDPKLKEEWWDNRPFHGQLQPSAIWLDPSAFHKREHDSIAQNFLKHGIYAARAINDRLGGWTRMGNMLNERLPDGYPRLQFFSNCQLATFEIPNLRVKPGTDDVEKVNDDAADTVRYALMSQQPDPEEDDPEKERTRASELERILAARNDPRSLASRGRLYEG